VATVPTERLEAPHLHAEAARFYVPELDSLRFFAFLAVFICHLFHELGGSLVITNTGTFGVDLFFTLSAYLITELLMREKERFGRVDVKSFYVRRILRIWPLYLGFLATVFIVLKLHPVARITDIYLITYMVFLGNFARALWPKIGLGLVIDPLWSVSVEEQFYLTWPLVVRYLTRRGVAIAGVLIWSFSIAARWILTREGFSPPAIELSTLSRLDPIACGLLLSSFLGGSIQPRLRLSRRLLIIIGVNLWVIAGFCLFSSGTPAPRDFILAFPLAAIGCGAFLLATIGSGSWMCNSRLIYLGRISYGLYVYHGVVILATLAIFASCPSWVKWLLCPMFSLGGTIAVSTVSYRWFETPFLKLKARFQYIRSASPAIG
jgi:peptidoglycan/LPS O-acetylase OafA/YrhL